jgi:mannitol/fructose-specific phosphotransferase system IIA component
MNRIFNEDNIVLNATLKDKKDAIEQAGKILVKQGYVKRKYVSCMHKREEVISTYIGNNVAIPHGIDGSDKYIKESGISFIQVPEGVDYGGETAYVVMGVAGKDGTHLDILMQLAGIICEAENVEKLRNAKTKQEILDIIGELE